MAGPIDYIRNKIGPPRFVAFAVILVVAAAAGFSALGWKHALMTGFDVAAAFFLIAIFPVLRTRDPGEMRRQSRENDVNRVMLLAISTIVTTAIIVAVAAEMSTKDTPNILLIVGTLALAWLFSNTVYALHYAHLFYIEDKVGGIDFPGTKTPDYADFVYFAFTLGMTFQTSDCNITARHIRIIVTVHSVAAFVFNIGVLAFSINVLGSG